MRTTTLFNRDWFFAPTVLPFDASDSQFESVVLPHTNKLFSHRHVDNNTYQFISTYRKRFHLPEPRANRRVFIDFDGAMLVSEVFLNGAALGIYKGGFNLFSFELTDFLVDGENVLSVYLDSNERKDVPPYGELVDYLTFGGIYRDVYLRMVEPVYIKHVFARPVDVLTAPRLECDIQLSDTAADTCLECVLSDSAGQIITQSRTSVTEKAFTINLPDSFKVSLWSPENPALYDLKVNLFQGETLLDAITERIGFRHAEFRQDGFFLNGKRLKLVGLNRHQTYPYIGAAAPARLQRQDADILKYELGCNIVRTSHYPQSPHFLRHCDEIGLLVFEEIPGWQHIGDEAWQELVLRDVRAMIERDRNHPAIILWGVRINESADDDELYTRTNALAHELDPTRQTGGVRNLRGKVFQEDVFTFNDFTNAVVDPQYVPYLITEFGGHTFPTKIWDHEERRCEHALLHVRVMDLQFGRDDVAGAIGWCAFDYNTHQHFGSGDRICHHGVMDIFRLPKWAGYFYKSQRPPQEAVVLQSATIWSVGDRSGGGVNPLIVFSNCDEIEVFAGEEYMGRFVPDREHYPHLKHPPFVVEWIADDPWGSWMKDLRVAGYLNGQVAAEQRFDASHLPNELELTPDTTELYADGSDMTRIAVRITDCYGNVLPFILSVVQFEITGEAELIGENPMPLIGGQGAVYVKAGLHPGQVTVKAQALTSLHAAVTLDLSGG